MRSCQAPRSLFENFVGGSASRKVAGTHYVCSGITSAVFSIEGKTPEKKEILKISDSRLEMSFLSNFNISVNTVRSNCCKFVILAVTDNTYQIHHYSDLELYCMFLVPVYTHM